MSEGADKLSEEKAATFHSTLAKLLWIMKRSRPDIEADISCLWTQVKDPAIHYWGKMIQWLQLPSQTIGDDHVIGADNIYEVLTYVDTSYDMHNNIIGHTGGCMTFGWGLINEK